MRYALIGCGRIAPNHLRAARQAGLEIAALCDADPAAMETLAARAGLEERAGGSTGIKRYTDHQTLLAEARPELAAIATPSGSHAAIALDCIDAGVPVIIEKPIALSLADADAIIRRAEAKGVPVATCHQNRFNRAVQALHGAVAAGRFGALSHGSIQVRWNRGPDYYRQAPWRGTWGQDGGALMNQCIHGIDILRWMMGGEIETVYGDTARRLHAIEGEDVGLAVVRFKNGALGTIEGTVNVYPHNLEETLCVFGERGTAKLGGRALNTVEVWRFADDPEGAGAANADEEIANVYGNGHGPLYADMIRAIQAGGAPAVDARAGRDALELVLAVYKSRHTGQPVHLPLDDFSTLEMRGTFD